MHAAVVRAFDRPPRYEYFDTPAAQGENEVLVDVLAAGLHPRVRAGADGTHYTSRGALPLIPGIDGVGARPDGQRVYFVAPDRALGTMAEQAVADRRLSVLLPAGADPVTLAAAMNPAMSSWLALRRRLAFAPGQRVLILGATGNAGQLAIQVAKRLGAAQVIAAGREAARLAGLAALGADVTVSLAGDPEAAAARVGAAAAEVDVVLDYVWGAPAERLMPALLARRADRGRPLDWVQIGSTAGPAVALRSEVLRSANFRLLGSGQGALRAADILAELPALVAEIAAGTLTVNARAVPLADVEAAWTAPAAPGERVVFVPR